MADLDSAHLDALALGLDKALTSRLKSGVVNAIDNSGGLVPRLMKIF